MHEPYEKRLRHPADFRVSYRFYKPDEGGRPRLPMQGLRSDFQFEPPYVTLGDRPAGTFIIWPEFEDEEGNVIMDDTKPVRAEGTARMWIIIPERRIIHKVQIRVGLKGHFWEGGKTADCTVIEIIGLMSNPVK